ncbi:hypothetical protein NGA_2034400, partial [Nannochloropsis gaditana CCMP526]|uniref:uncharacterized protein n=1 Tax=Nannochloropsis gaditana (strain CCMP526) TaxID=1093141 RepID=UPI00029F7FC4
RSLPRSLGLLPLPGGPEPGCMERGPARAPAQRLGSLRAGHLQRRALPVLREPHLYQRGPGHRGCEQPAGGGPLEPHCPSARQPRDLSCRLPPPPPPCVRRRLARRHPAHADLRPIPAANLRQHALAPSPGHGAPSRRILAILRPSFLHTLEWGSWEGSGSPLGVRTDLRQQQIARGRRPVRGAWLGR